jgi:hypothetical protein
MIIQSIHDLNASLALRNGLIETYRPIAETNHFMNLYLGLPYGDGHVDMNYPQTMDTVVAKTDDLIYFSSLLCSDLYKHGKQLSEEFKRKFKKGALRVSRVDLSQAAGEGLMPDAAKYAGWDRAFPPSPSSDRPAQKNV